MKGLKKEEWFFKLPVEVHFGLGVAGRISEAIEKAQRIVLVTDQGVAGQDFMRGIESQLLPVSIFKDVHPNPTVDDVDVLAGILRDQKADALVAVGGGSVMDCAKAACCLAQTDELSMRVFHTGRKKFTIPGIPLIVIPTTAGTGSEVTPIVVLDDPEKGVKLPMASDLFYPGKALIDPELTFGLPKKITAATSLDALSHAIEGFWSKNNQPICDLVAKEAARLIFANLPAVYRNPADVKSRSAMSKAALFAGMAFQLPRNAMVHACSYPLSSLYHLSHGAACAFTLEFAIRLNAPAMKGRMEEFASYCGFTLDEMIAAIRRLKQDGGLPCTLKEAGIPIEGVPELIRESFHPVMKNNPVAVTEEHLRQMYEELVS